MARSGEPPGERTPDSLSVVAVLVVLSAALLAVCWVLVPLILGRQEFIAGTILAPFVLAVGLIWLAWALAARRVAGTQAYDSRR